MSKFIFVMILSLSAATFAAPPVTRPTRHSGSGNLSTTTRIHSARGYVGQTRTYKSGNNTYTSEYYDSKGKLIGKEYGKRSK